jgi:hypothetical protein
VREPGEKQSHIERLYEDLRHRTVHYPWVGKPEIADVLRQLGHVPVELRHEGGELRAGWTELVAALWTLGIEPGSSEWIKDFDPRRAVLMTAVANWITLWPVTLIPYARRQGIELSQIIDPSTLPPEVRPDTER